MERKRKDDNVKISFNATEAINIYMWRSSDGLLIWYRLLFGMYTFKGTSKFNNLNNSFTNWENFQKVCTHYTMTTTIGPGGLPTPPKVTFAMCKPIRLASWKKECTVYTIHNQFKQYETKRFQPKIQLSFVCLTVIRPFVPSKWFAIEKRHLDETLWDFTAP